jgi:Mn-dependent DtxR family transcriptional regulator
MNPKTLSAYILHAIATAQREGRFNNLDTLRRELGVRRADVRSAVTALHRQGFVDATRMRLTLAGFTLALALQARPLPPLRTQSKPAKHQRGRASSKLAA